VTPAEIRFRQLWQTLFGGPMFPAKPLRWAGVIHPRQKATRNPLAPEIAMVLVPCPDGCKRLAWMVEATNEKDALQKFLMAIEVNPKVFSLGE
jgi:hypothetical protein